MRVIKGEGIFESNGHAADTRVRVTCEGVTFSSKVVSHDSTPDWNLSCVFDLRRADPLHARIRINVRAKRSPWQRATLGSHDADIETLIAAAHGITSTHDLPVCFLCCSRICVLCAYSQEH